MDSDMDTENSFEQYVQTYERTKTLLTDSVK